MPTKLGKGQFTIKDIWLYTYQQYRNRFDFRDRDVLKSVVVNELKVYSKDRKEMPSKKYEIKTSSYPQYKPYINVKGKNAKKQRKIRHSYDIVFQLSEGLTWNSPFKWRVGSQKKWPDDSKINYNQIKQLHSSIREKFEKKYGKGTDKYKEAVAKHKKESKVY